MENANKKTLLAVLLSVGIGGMATAAVITTAVESGNFMRTLPTQGTWYGTNETGSGNGDSNSVFWQYNNGASGYSYRYWVRFALPELGYGSASITNVDLKLTQVSNFFVGYGVGVLYCDTQASNADYPQGENVASHPGFASGVSPTSSYTNYHLVDNYLTSGPTENVTYTTDVTSVIKQAYANGLDYAWFTVYTETQSGSAGQNNWQSVWGTQYNANTAYRPTLTIVPEPAALSLLALGALAGLGRRRR